MFKAHMIKELAGIENATKMYREKLDKCLKITDQSKREKKIIKIFDQCLRDIEERAGG